MRFDIISKFVQNHCMLPILIQIRLIVTTSVLFEHDEEILLKISAWESNSILGLTQLQDMAMFADLVNLRKKEILTEIKCLLSTDKKINNAKQKAETDLVENKKTQLFSPR